MMRIFARKPKETRLSRSYGGDIFINIILFAMGIIMILPMVFAISNSLRPLDELWIFPPRFIVQNPTLGNFRDLLNVMNEFRVPFTRYIFNTVLVTVVGTTGHVLISSMCAYAFAKHKFPGSKIMFALVVTALMFNSMVTIIPSFLIMSRLGWVDTYLPYFVPAFAAPLGLFLMKQFMEQMVPDSLLEAARMDGYGEFKILFKIVMPLVKPAWLTLTIFSVQALWNTGGTHMVYTEELKTLNFALSQILLGGVARAGVGAAAGVIMMIVPIAVFIVTQSNIITTMSMAGMKE